MCVPNDNMFVGSADQTKETQSPRPAGHLLRTDNCFSRLLFILVLSAFHLRISNNNIHCWCILCSFCFLFKRHPFNRHKQAALQKKSNQPTNQTRDETTEVFKHWGWKLFPLRFGKWAKITNSRAACNENGCVLIVCYPSQILTPVKVGS